jgi:hypothetical protein
VTIAYRVYGFTLASNVAIPALGPPLSRESAFPDTYCEIGDLPGWAAYALTLPQNRVPMSRSCSGEDGWSFQLSEYGDRRFFRLSYGDGACFVIDAETRRIWAACPGSLTFEDLTTYLVGPVMGFVLRRRGVLTLHASCFCVGGHAFALCGGAGAGKSTTAAALALREIPILCEDVAALRERQRGFWAAPGYPRVNLWPESVKGLLGTADALPRITPTWGKRFLPLDGETAKFESQERPLAAIYLVAPRTNDEGAPRIETPSQREAALLLVQNTYMNYLLDGTQRAQEFDSIAHVVSSVAVRRLIPHRDPSRIGTMCELLEADATEIAASGGRQGLNEHA